MNKKRKMALSAFMILVMIGMLLVPTAMATTDEPSAFTITINSGQSTTVTTNTDTTFDAALAGSTNELADSFDLTNVGNVAATVEAKFTTYRDAVYGLNGSATIIPGTSFSMAETSQSYVALLATDADQAMGAGNNVAADAAADQWKVRLIVPSGQAAESYSGTVQLTFADA